MSLWAYIPDKTLVAVGALPQSARRLDTGELVNDLPGVNMIWARAAGWWNLDSPTIEPDLIAAKTLTADEAAALKAEIVQALAERQQRHNYVDDARTRWAGSKDQGQDRLDLIPPYERPVRPAQGAPTATWIAYLEQNDAYLDNWVRFIQQTLIGGGTTSTPGLGDLMMVIAQVVAGLLDQVDGIVLPD